MSVREVASILCAINFFGSMFAAVSTSEQNLPTKNWAKFRNDITERNMTCTSHVQLVYTVYKRLHDDKLITGLLDTSVMGKICRLWVALNRGGWLYVHSELPAPSLHPVSTP